MAGLCRTCAQEAHREHVDSHASLFLLAATRQTSPRLRVKVGGITPLNQGVQLHRCGGMGTCSATSPRIEVTRARNMWQTVVSQARKPPNLRPIPPATSSIRSCNVQTMCSCCGDDSAPTFDSAAAGPAGRWWACLGAGGDELVTYSPLRAPRLHPCVSGPCP